ncbi:MAG: putative glycosyltransferase, partial [Microgenomates group bacterium GW2011_GWC1_39_7]
LASVFHFPTISGAIKTYFFNQKEYFGKYQPKENPAKVNAVVMAALLIPRSVIEKVGLVSEKFFMYYEDIEFCQRLKKANLPVFYYPNAKIESKILSFPNLKLIPSTQVGAEPPNPQALFQS